MKKKNTDNFSTILNLSSLNLAWPFNISNSNSFYLIILWANFAEIGRVVQKNVLNRYFKYFFLILNSMVTQIPNHLSTMM